MTHSSKSINKMKFSTEAKIGLIGLATLVVLIWGINYLKGRNILTSSYTLEAFLDHASGLGDSTPVLLNGVKIGYVRRVTLRMDEEPPIRIELTIEKAYPVRTGAMAVIHSSDLLGTKAIRIDSGSGSGFLQSGDTIAIGTEPDMLTSLQDQLTPIMGQVGSLAVSMDSLAKRLDELVDSEEIRATLQNLRSVSASVDRNLRSGGSLDQSFNNLASFSKMLTEREEDLANISLHLKSFSESLENAHIEQLSENMVSVTHQFDALLTQINSGEGSAGRLIYTDSLHMELQRLITDLDFLIRDLNENPQDYVHFSLFGKSQKRSE
jgi:phospholipid/cholesterol/gamma-HCH transport system substrate-binding protein